MGNAETERDICGANSLQAQTAAAHNRNPAQYRIALLDGKGKNDGGAQRLRNTLLAAMGLAGYGTKQLPKGEGMGVACVSSQERASASWTACVAHVAVAPSGEVKVKKLTVATDVGTQVHPDNIRAQVEGAALWGLSLAMYEKATLKDGGIEQTNFDTYTPLRMSQMPEAAVNVIANGEKATGVGEPPAVTVVAPALGNAIFNACGARIRPLPITAEAVKASMKASCACQTRQGSAGGFLRRIFSSCPANAGIDFAAAVPCIVRFPMTAVPSGCRTPPSARIVKADR